MEKLKQSLQELNKEIEKAQVSDPVGEQRLGSLQENVQACLQHDEPAPQHHGLLAELTESAELFETSHPRLSELMNQLINMLGSMGI